MLRHALLCAAAALTLAACGQPDEPASAPPEPTISTHALPDAVSYPEGVAVDADAGVFYTAGAADGAVARVNLSDWTSAIVAPAGTLVPAGSTVFPAALGMKVDEAKRLWIAGGRTGKLHVLDTATGAVVKTIDTPASPGGLINDVTLTADAAYFSDSFRPVVWKVSRAGGQVGDAERWLDLEPAIPHAEGANINGLVATPDGRTLLLVQMNKGVLYKVDVASKGITPVDLNGQTVAGADGLVLDGQRLYVVLQPHAEVVAIDLAADMASGTVAGRLKTDQLAWPATAFKHGDKLVVVNTQFNKRGDNAAVTPFTVSEVPVSMIK